MKKLIFTLMLLTAIRCSKEEQCYKSSRIYTISSYHHETGDVVDVVRQEFTDGSSVTLAYAGQIYKPFNNTCELW